MHTVRRSPTPSGISMSAARSPWGPPNVLSLAIFFPCPPSAVELAGITVVDTDGRDATLPDKMYPGFEWLKNENYGSLDASLDSSVNFVDISASDMDRISLLCASSPSISPGGDV